MGQELRFGRGIEGIFFGVHRPGRALARSSRLLGCLGWRESRAELAGNRKRLRTAAASAPKQSRRHFRPYLWLASIVMHDVVAVALITGGTAVLGSGVTYLATKRQADRQAETERERIKAEAERMRIQYDEEHVRHRQTTYHDLLTNVSAWHREFAAGGMINIQQQTVWLQRLEQHFNGVFLFSSQGVFAPLVALKATVEEGMRAGSDGAFQARYQAAYDATMEAMRKDTAPGF